MERLSSDSGVNICLLYTSHEQSARFGGAEVFIKPASHGTGVVAGGAMRAVLESVGVTDVLAKSKGASNPHKLVKATMEALSEIDVYKRQVQTISGLNTYRVVNAGVIVLTENSLKAIDNILRCV